MCSRSSRYLYLSYSEKKIFFLLKKWNSLSAIITRGLINSHYTKSNYCHAKIFLYPFLCGTCCRKLPPVIFALASQFHAWWFQRFLTKGSLTFSRFYQCYSKLDFFAKWLLHWNMESQIGVCRHIFLGLNLKRVLETFYAWFLSSGGCKEKRINGGISCCF